MTVLQMSMHIPPDLLKQIAFLRTPLGNKAMRRALEAGNRPPRNAVKALILQVRNRSKQSTGATHRAVGSKVSYPAKRKPNTGYAMVGINYSTVENHLKNTKLDRKLAGLKRNKLKLFGVKKSRFGRPGNRIDKFSAVRSYQTTSARVRKGDHSQINRPAKYWHLINNGFRHRSGRVFPGYQFIQRTLAATETASVAAFTRILGNALAKMS